jgi:hypothetical protein
VAPGRLIAAAVALAAALVGLAIAMTGGAQTPPAEVNAKPAAQPVAHTAVKHMRPTRPAAAPADTPPPPAPTPVAPTLGTYAATYYTVDRPVDWTTEHDDEQQSGGLLRSQWRDPDNSSTSILIDAQEESASAQDKANQVRAATSNTPGYQEISFRPTTMNGVSAIRWEFTVSGTHRIDYFVHDDSCGVGVAVLGSSSPGDFEALRQTFSDVADSVSIDCSSASANNPAPAPAPAQTKCDPNYSGACLDPTSSDYDCVGGSGDGPDYTGEVKVVGNDHFQLDRDGDGIACEPN